MHNCWNATDDSIPAVPVPEPWDELQWYRSLKERFELRWWKNHPVSGNLTCMVLALNLALKGVDNRWFHPTGNSGQYIVDADFQFPYFANNLFLMRTDRYLRVIGHQNCCHGTDERMMNQLLHEEKASVCLDAQTFGIHPAWGNFGQSVKNALELHSMRLMRQLFLTSGLPKVQMQKRWKRKAAGRREGKLNRPENINKCYIYINIWHTLYLWYTTFWAIMDVEHEGKIFFSGINWTQPPQLATSLHMTCEPLRYIACLSYCLVGKVSGWGSWDCCLRLEVKRKWRFKDFKDFDLLTHRPLVGFLRSWPYAVENGRSSWWPAWGRIFCPWQWFTKWVPSLRSTHETTVAPVLWL